VFGTIGYDLVRLVEPLPDINPDPLDLPDAILTRPSIVAVFDGVAQEIILSTTAWPSSATAEAAYAEACGRLEAIASALAKPAPPLMERAAKPEPGLQSPVSREAYWAIVERAKRYIEAGDVFQVVPSHRFRTPFTSDPFALYRSLRRTNPSPFLFYLNFGDFQLVGSSPEILVRLRDGKITIRPIAGTRPRGATPEQDQALEAELRTDPKEHAEHLMLLDLGRNDVGRVAMLGQSGRNAPEARARYAEPRASPTWLSCAPGSSSSRCLTDRGSWRRQRRSARPALG